MNRLETPWSEGREEERGNLRIVSPSSQIVEMSDLFGIVLFETWRERLYSRTVDHFI